MRCQACGYDNEATSRSCVACGFSFASVCDHCGRDFPETARFCAWCGEPRKLDARVADVPSERKQATILFADVAGSTERIAGLDAEGAMNFLHPIVMVMARAVHRFDGTVLRTLGDGLKAAFGVPHAREAHAVLACHAALAMRAAVAALPDAPKIRIGLHSGEVVSGKLHTGSAIEQDATGLTVHLASRIEQVAPPGEICLSRDCQTLLGAYCDTEPLGPRTLKGIPDPVEVFRLIGLKPAVNSEHFRGVPLVPLRGRAVELETLQRALLDAAPGSPRVIGVSGLPGVGKSRLCFEFGEWCRERQIKVLEARAQVYSRATPLLPVLEALRAFFRIEPDMDAELARSRIEQTLTELALPVAEDLAILTDFLGCAEAEPPPRAIDPTTRRMRLRASVGRIVKAAGWQTSVIIVEDLHWLDEASQDFLETWMAAVEGTRVLVVLTFRPDWSLPSRPAWYRELALPELSLGEVGQVICDLIGDGAGLDQVVAHVAERSDGNPFFAEELILSLAQSGVLVGERGRYRLAPSGWQNPTLPTTVEAVIGARIDLLPESEKILLQTAAIIGKEFPFEVVRAVTGLSDTAARPLLRRLRAAELIQPRETAMGESFAFRHPLIQEVAYAMQLRSTRTSLHAAVAQAIDGLEWGRRDEFAGLLAHHYEAAGNMVAAAMHLQRSARWVGRTNSGRALADWKKIRRMMQDQPRLERMLGKPYVIRGLLQMDDAEHAAYRAVAQPSLTPGALAAMEPWLDTWADHVVGRIAGRTDPFDFTREIAVPFSIRGIMRLLGLPEADDDLILKLSWGLVGPEDPVRRLADHPTTAICRAGFGFQAYFDPIAADRRACPRHDLSSAIATAQVQGETMPDYERFSYYAMIATGGHDTIAFCLSGGMHALIEHPGQLARLRADPSLIDTAIEEMLRWTTPGRHIVRTATEDIELGGQTIRAGEAVALFFNSANRDETVFADAEQFRIDRRPNPHLAFGLGQHHCIGAHLARREMRALLKTLLPRLESVELAAPPHRTCSTMVSGISSLSIRCAWRAPDL